MTQTLLERWDRTDHKETINSDEIRRAIAIAQAVDAMGSGTMPGCCDTVIHSQIMDYADELLKEGK